MDDYVDSKQLLKTIKKYNIETLLFVHFKKAFKPETLHQDSQDNTSAKLMKKYETNEFLFKMLDSMKLQYEFIDISSNITHLSLTGLLASIIAKYNTKTLIDLTFCPKTFVPIIIQTVYYIPDSIKEFT